MTIDWVSFGAGAVSGIFLVTLARVVQRMTAEAGQPGAPAGPAMGTAPLAAVPAAEAGRPVTAPLAAEPASVTAPFGSTRPIRPTTAPLAFVADLPPEVVAGKLVREHPYLAAYVLDHMDHGFVERVLTLMGEGPRRDVQDLLGRDEPLKLSGEAFIALLHRLKASALGGAS